MAAQHRSARRRVVAPVAALLLAAAVVSLSGTAFVLWPDNDPRVAQAPDAPEPCATTLRVVTAMSYAPVLEAVAPTLETGEDCAAVDVEVIDGREAAARVTETGAHLWIPDDAAWAGATEGVELATEGSPGLGTVVAESPLYLVTDEPTAVRVREAGGGWGALAELVSSGSGVRLVVREPGGSGDGMLGAGAVGEAVWITEGMDASAETLASALPATRTVGGQAMPTQPGEVGVVAEYALLPALQAGATDGMTVLAAADHSALLRYSWLPTAAGTADTSLAAPMARLLEALTGPAAEAALATAGLRTPGTSTPPQGAPDGLPAVTAAPYEVLASHHVDHVFATWYAQDRRSNVLVAVDVSGSMAAVAPGSDRPLIDLVRDGVLALAEQLPDDSELELWQFGSLLDGPRDHVALLGRAPLTGAQREGLVSAVGALQSQDTGTGLYDTMLATYLTARETASPGVQSLAVVFTDGRNEDDPGSITIEDLTQQLTAAQDPSRPVQLTVAAFGDQPEAELLAAAVAPINGYIDPLTTADQVRAMFLHVAAGGVH